MAAIDYASDTQLTGQTHTGDTDWTDVPGASIADADITDSGEYILLVTAQVGGDNISEQFGFRVVIGTTPTVLPGSTKIMEPGIATEHANYMFLHKFNASASAGENIIKFQFQATSLSTTTVNADTIVMLAINLDSLDATDWHYGEDDDTGATTQLTTSFVDFATTGAFTPNGTDDWMLLFCANYLINASNVNAEFRLRLDGSTASPDDDAPLFSEEGENVAEEKVYGLSRVFTPTNASHQWWVQGRDDATGTNEHQYSAIFALRLNAFQDHAFQWTEALEELDEIDVYEEVAAINPDIGPTTSDVIVIGSAIADFNAGGNQGNLRAQLGGTTTPTGRDSNRDARSYDSTDENPMFTMFVIPSASGTQDLDLDAQMNAIGNGGGVEDRSFIAFSAELAAAAARRRGLIPTRHGRR